MKLSLLLTAVVLLGIACTDNKLTIVNEVEETIHFSFRGKRTIIPPRSEQVLTDMPNGTFEYSTSWVLQAGDRKQIQEEENLRGALTFQRSSSEILIIYNYTSRIDSIGYMLGATVSSSDPVGMLVSP